MSNRASVKIVGTICPNLHEKVAAKIKYYQNTSANTSKTPLQKNVALFDDLSWQLASHFNPIYAEQRIELMLHNTETLIEHVLDQLLRFKEDKFTEGIAWSSHQLCLLYKVQRDEKSASLRKKVAKDSIGNCIPGDPFYAQLTYHYHDLGILMLKLSDRVQGKRYLKRALRRYACIGGMHSLRCMGDIHYRLGGIALSKQHYKQMKKHYKLALPELEGDALMDERCAEMGYQLGLMKFNSKSWKRADDYFIISARFYEKIQRWDSVSKVYSYLCQIRKKQKLPDESRKYMEKSNHFMVLSVSSNSAPPLPASVETPPDLPKSLRYSNESDDKPPLYPEALTASRGRAATTSSLNNASTKLTNTSNTIRNTNIALPSNDALRGKNDTLRVSTNPRDSAHVPTSPGADASDLASDSNNPTLYPHLHALLQSSPAPADHADYQASAPPQSPKNTMTTEIPRDLVLSAKELKYSDFHDFARGTWSPVDFRAFEFKSSNPT